MQTRDAAGILGIDVMHASKVLVAQAFRTALISILPNHRYRKLKTRVLLVLKECERQKIIAIEEDIEQFLFRVATKLAFNAIDMFFDGAVGEEHFFSNLDG